MAALCQTAADTTPLYKQFPTFPAFKFDNAADSSKWSKDNLKKKKLTLLMVFSPDCEHCQHETKELLARIEEFKKIQIVMITWLPWADMKKFYQDYKIADYPNITMARDPGFQLPPWFKIDNLPFLAFFDKKGKLVSMSEGSISIDKILGTFAQ